ncbi:hypothetical protein D3C85_1706540 [compost metagenome]
MTSAFASTIPRSVASVSVETLLETSRLETSESALALILAFRSRSQPSDFDRLLIAV